eukprot:scaffold803_cov310-Pinguiococcus_pyrenoidosus.AAC.175
MLASTLMRTSSCALHAAWKSATSVRSNGRWACSAPSSRRAEASHHEASNTQPQPLRGRKQRLQVVACRTHPKDRSRRLHTLATQANQQRRGFGCHCRPHARDSLYFCNGIHRHPLHTRRQGSSHHLPTAERSCTAAHASLGGHRAVAIRHDLHPQRLEDPQVHPVVVDNKPVGRNDPRGQKHSPSGHRRGDFPNICGQNRSIRPRLRLRAEVPGSGSCAGRGAETSDVSALGSSRLLSASAVRPYTPGAVGTRRTPPDEVDDDFAAEPLRRCRRPRATEDASDDPP